MAKLILKITDILSLEEIEQIYKECKEECEHIERLGNLLDLYNISFQEDTNG